MKIGNSEKLVILAIVILLLTLHFLTLPATFNLNKSIGWGWDSRDIYGMILRILNIGVIAFALFSIKKNGLKKTNLLSLVISSSGLFIIVRQHYMFMSMLPN